MSFTPFTLASGTVVYLDPKGQITATLLGTRTVTINDFSSKQEIAEAMLANAPANFVLNEANLLYQDGDHNIKFGAGAVPIDQGSASPSISPSASPSVSTSASPSAS
jgi:hypothetical protein